MKPGDTLVLASGNAGKLRELDALLAPRGWQVRPQSDWSLADAVENAATFVENALIKARHACRSTGLPALADDSGLVVPALGGAPGIHSARYAGEPADPERNIDRLLEALGGRRGDDRRAHFHCTVVLLNSADDPDPLIASARWHGRILEERRGDGGFGYDPVFAPDVDGEPGDTSAAELAPADKARLSHRGMALARLLAQCDDLGL